MAVIAFTSQSTARTISASSIGTLRTLLLEGDIKERVLEGNATTQQVTAVPTNIGQRQIPKPRPATSEVSNLGQRQIPKPRPAAPPPTILPPNRRQKGRGGNDPSTPTWTSNWRK